VLQKPRVRFVGSGVRRITRRCRDPWTHKLLGARTHQLGGRYTCAQDGRRAAAELDRWASRTRLASGKQGEESMEHIEC
jgi:hypothetical protein